MKLEKPGLTSAPGSQDLTGSFPLTVMGYCYEVPKATHFVCVVLNIDSVCEFIFGDFLFFNASILRENAP